MLVSLNKKTKKLCINLYENTINTEFDWKCYIYNLLFEFLNSNKEGVCQIKVYIFDYKPVLKDLLEYFDLKFPRRIHISWG